MICLNYLSNSIKIAFQKVSFLNILLKELKKKFVFRFGNPAMKYYILNWIYLIDLKKSHYFFF